ncbi:hypothetical protein V6N13_024853 [Hibiscus sabdariffa]
MAGISRTPSTNNPSSHPLEQWANPLVSIEEAKKRKLPTVGPLKRKCALKEKMGKLAKNEQIIKESTFETVTIFKDVRDSFELR